MSYDDLEREIAKRQEVAMKTMQVRSRVGADGMLELKLPSGLSETDVDVVVVVNPVPPSGWKSEAERQEWQEFVRTTAGAWQGEPFERPEQGEFEKREEWG
jgi:hypothetical protein